MVSAKADRYNWPLDGQLVLPVRDHFEENKFDSPNENESFRRKKVPKTRKNTLQLKKTAHGIGMECPAEQSQGYKNTDAQKPVHSGHPIGLMHGWHFPFLFLYDRRRRPGTDGRYTGPLLGGWQKNRLHLQIVRAKVTTHSCSTIVSQEYIIPPEVVSKQPHQFFFRSTFFIDVPNHACKTPLPP